MAVRRIGAKVERKVQKAKEKVKDILRPHTPVSKAALRENLRTHSATPSSHSRTSADSTTSGRGAVSGGTRSPFDTAHRPTSELRAEPEGLDAENPNPQGLEDATNSKLINVQ
jgi:hypothetical protein